MEVYGDGKKVTRLVVGEGNVPFLRGAQISEAAFVAYVLRRAMDDKAGKIVESMVVPTNAWRLTDDQIRAESQRVARLAREAEICSVGSQEIEVLGRRLFEGEDAQIVYETYMAYGAPIAAEKSPPSAEPVTIQDSRGVDLDIAEAFRGSVQHLAEPSVENRAPVPDRLSPAETIIDTPSSDVGSVVEILNTEAQALRG
ncbi:MAG TPA: hypothetical protein VLH86_06110, partial [Patescibacteria group bacterium]|nr:hypothetical protein [Patescibacteria group bacterium]